MPANISVQFKVHETNGYKLALIGDPLQSHVVAWEQASRKLKNEDAKPLLHKIMQELSKISVVNRNIGGLLTVFQIVTESLEQAIQILDDNETLTMSANRGVMVKAAIMAGWVVFLETVPEKPEDGSVRLMESVDEVDHMKPWLVTWIAECVASLYLEATTIPKN
jgi:hypothetical protein